MLLEAIVANLTIENTNRKYCVIKLSNAKMIDKKMQNEECVLLCKIK